MSYLSKAQISRQIPTPPKRPHFLYKLCHVLLLPLSANRQQNPSPFSVPCPYPQLPPSFFLLPFVQTSLAMAAACLLSLPSPLCNKTKHPHSSTIPSKSLKLQLSCSNSSLFLSSPSLIRRSHSPSILTFVAQTSDWAQQEADDTVAVVDDEPTWENQEVDNTKAGLSDWEAEGSEDGEYAEPSEDAKMYVGNLPYDVDSQKLAMLFEQAGTVEIAEVIYNRETDRSRGFGFETMSTVEEAEKAVEKFGRYDLDGRLLTVNKAAPRGSLPERPPRAFEPAFRIHVGNLPWDVDNARLEQMFIEQGTVLNAQIVYDRITWLWLRQNGQ